MENYIIKKENQTKIVNGIASALEKFFKNNLKGKTIGVWGLAFKPNTNDIRYAPSIEMINLILKHNASVLAYDPVASLKETKTFSHPKYKTPVCSTELGEVEKLADEFKKRNVKTIGLSVDTVDETSSWLDDINDIAGVKPSFPIIADTNMEVSKMYNMLPTSEAGTSDGRTAKTIDIIKGNLCLTQNFKRLLILK